MKLPEFIVGYVWLVRDIFFYVLKIHSCRLVCLCHSLVVPATSGSTHFRWTFQSTLNTGCDMLSNVIKPKEQQHSCLTFYGLMILKASKWRTMWDHLTLPQIIAKIVCQQNGKLPAHSMFVFRSVWNLMTENFVCRWHWNTYFMKQIML